MCNGHHGEQKRNEGLISVVSYLGPKFKLHGNLSSIILGSCLFATPQPCVVQAEGLFPTLPEESVMMMQGKKETGCQGCHFSY